MPHEKIRTEALAGLALHLSAPLQARTLQEALEAAQAIPDERNRAEVLTRLVPCLGELGKGKEALEIARTIPNEGAGQRRSQDWPLIYQHLCCKKPWR